MDQLNGWFEKLCMASGMGEAARVLAQAVGETAQATGSSVFLLDSTRDNLLLFASWSEEHGAVLEQKQAIPARSPDDPLCVALLQGNTVTLTPRPGMGACPSMELAMSSPAHCGATLSAHPLLAWNAKAIGGVVWQGRGQTHNRDAVRILCGYAALLLAFFERNDQDSARINSLHADLVRLEQFRKLAEDVVRPMLVGDSAAMRQVRDRIAQVAPHDVSVLLTGETGTGKDLAALAVHAASMRAEAPFVKINCGALPEPLLESELFGYKKGAFSGADKDHIGLLRSAAGGTVLLDEIGDMPLPLQVKLLRALQDREIRPVGGIHSYPVDIRIIAATNSDLEEAVARGQFRKDLYYRIVNWRIHMPPLNERREDIPALAMLFSRRFAAAHKMPELDITHTQMAALCSLDYPGNVRELASKIESAVISLGIEYACDMQFNIVHKKPETKSMPLAECVKSYEMSLINAAIACHDNNTTRAARALGIPRTSLLKKIQKNRRTAQTRRR